MTTSSTWDRICRICSSPAQYEVFAKIPSFLHGNLNEHWQKPVNALIEATTGLKVTRGDGLPQSICALCISYLKHAACFREQAISNAMSLTAVKLLRQKTRLPLSDKDSLLITSESLNYAAERQEDTNELLNNYAPDQLNKVNKPMLINNFQPVTPPTQADVDQQMRYINLLFDKDPNAGQRRKGRGNVAVGYDPDPGSGEPNVEEEEFQTATTTTSSDDNLKAQGATKKQNIFSYREKNFEEDDIMDMDELRNAISVTIPESCKERKCRACFRRFMFSQSYIEHMDTCIEYKFLTYIEEINRYLDIRRNKAISPHEFIRRMIFCLRKTCEWLKDNCGDMLLPDLLQNGSGGGGGREEAAKQRNDSEGKSSATSSASGEQRAEQNPKIQLQKQLFMQQQQKPQTTDTQRDYKTEEQKRLLLTKTANSNDFNLESRLNNLFKTPKAPLLQPYQQRSSGTTTPISISNNILYEIERSQSRNSSNHQSDLESGAGGSHSIKPQLKKPFEVLASSTTKVNTAAPKSVTNSFTERLTFLKKLQLAASQTAPLQQSPQIFPAAATPLSEMRQEILTSASSVNESPPLMIIAPPTLSFSARCNACNIVFKTLNSLEEHNAMYHNHSSFNTLQPQRMVSIADVEADAERKRIIALFEEDTVGNT